MITLDGARGEGGGQILRAALGLSLLTGEPFRIERIRARRRRPGLQPQHLAAVAAAAEVGAAAVEGATRGSQTLVFRPGRVRSGRYHFAVGTAGSTVLVLQTVLLPLCLAAGPSSVRLEGGTHNPQAPPFEFLERSFLPLLARMGAGVAAVLDRPGFYPAGGGELRVEIAGGSRLSPLTLLERGGVRRRLARAMVARLPRTIAERELAVVRSRLGWGEDEVEIAVLDARATGPGNVLLLEVESEHVTEVISGFGQRGVPAETVAERAADEAQRYLASGVPVGVHLADQLLVPLAVAGGGAFRTLPLSGHGATSVAVIRELTGVGVSVVEEAGGVVVTISR